MNSFRENNSVSKKFFSIFFKIIGAIWIALSISVLWDKFSSTNFDFVTVISTLIIGSVGLLPFVWNFIKKRTKSLKYFLLKSVGVAWIILNVSTIVDDCITAGFEIGSFIASLIVGSIGLIPFVLWRLKSMAICSKCGKRGFMLKVDPYGMCFDCSQQELVRFKTIADKITSEQYQAMNIEEQLQKLTELQKVKNNEITALQQEITRLDALMLSRKQAVVQLDETIMLQEFGLYEPRYKMTNSEQYKLKLDSIRSEQKEMIKNHTAVIGNTNWQVNNSQAQGKKMIADMQKLLLRAFNSECDDIVEHVTYSNFDASLRRIDSSQNAISKLGSIMGISIAQKYYQLKIAELTLAFEYQQVKQKEKEEQKEIRAQMREEAKMRREIEEARHKIEKEQSHYQNALSKLLTQISNSGESDELLLKKKEIEDKLSSIAQSIKDIDYREANQKAGYVYIISNIGSFGENIYKIGMTRRLDPMERIDELGDASVPFDFDVHAMIFSEDAPKLEAALHKAFENRKLNMVNTRREFFNVTLDEVKAVVMENHDKTAEFIETASAEQYRVSQKMREAAVS